MNLNDDQRQKVAEWATLDVSCLMPELEDRPKHLLDALEKAEPYIDLIEAMLGTGAAVAESGGRLTASRREFALQVARKQRDEWKEEDAKTSGVPEYERNVQVAEEIMAALEAEGQAAESGCPTDGEDEVVAMIRKRGLSDPEERADLAGRIIGAAHEVAGAWNEIGDAMAARVEGSDRNVEPAARSRLAEATIAFGEAEQEAVALLGSAAEKGGA